MFKVLQRADDEIKASPGEYSEYYRAGVHCAYTKLIKYFNLTDQTPIYRAAIVLHPAYKFDYFEQEWASKPAWQSRCKKDVTALYEQYEEKYGQQEEEEDDQPVAPERLMHKKRRDSDSSSGEEGFNFHGMLSSEYRARKRQKLRSELERFTEYTLPEPNNVSSTRWLIGKALSSPIQSYIAWQWTSFPYRR